MEYWVPSGNAHAGRACRTNTNTGGSRAGIVERQTPPYIVNRVPTLRCRRAIMRHLSAMLMLCENANGY